MNQSIALKSAMTITTSRGNWIHESAWEADHVAFALNCSCFSGTNLERSIWVSKGGRGRPTPLGTGYHQSGRWIFETKDSKEFVAAMSFQWEDGLFSCAWMHFYDSGQYLTGERNPALWLIEALVQRLSPDMLALHGDSSFDSLAEIGERKSIAVPVGDTIIMTAIMRIAGEDWKQYSNLGAVRKDLDWIRRQVARENREQEFARKPRKAPFLVRLLLSMNPMRRRRREKSVHPIDRLKNRLA